MRVLAILSIILIFTGNKCDAQCTAQDDGQKTHLLSNAIVTPNNVTQQAMLSLDIRDIETLLQNNDFETARLVYQYGHNSLVFDDDGNPKQEKRNLMALSMNALKGSFDNDPTFVFHLYGLSGASSRPLEEVSGDQIKEAYTYASDFTGDLLADTLTGTLSVESMVALNLWMFTTHQLWHAVSDCAAVTYESLVEFEQEHVLCKGARSFDEVVAYWIGEDQSNGDDNGFALYALAQKAGGWFGVTDPEAPANTKIKRLYEEGRAIFSNGDACQDETHLAELWDVANKMISQMMVPLIQMLIRSMVELDFYKVQLYSIAVIPQISACKMSTFKFLENELLDNPYKSANFDVIMEALQSSYECLGLTCEDIGAYGTAAPQCEDIPRNADFAGYTPTTDVRSHALLDLDIIQLSILTKFEVYNNADLLYRFGKNSFNLMTEEYDSIQSIALRPERHDVNWFHRYVDYFGENNYANIIIEETLEGGGKWGSKSVDQRHAMITKTVKYQVMYMAILVCLDMAEKSCIKKESNKAAMMWDQAAAYLVGSLEGTSEGGSADLEDGQFIWNLANSLCTQFDTCNFDGYSEVSSELMNLFYAGKGELNSGDCSNLHETAVKIEQTLLVPIIQGILRYAIENVSHSSNSFDGDLASGEALALVVLPVLNHHYPESAEQIEKNMIWQEGRRPSRSGASTIGDAFAPLLEEFDLRCDYVGSFHNVDTCFGSGISAATSSLDHNTVKLFVTLVLGTSLFSSII